MSLALTGKLVNLLAVESGTGKNGKEWKKQSFIVDTGAQFNPQVCFSVFGEDKMEMLKGLSAGQEIEVSFNLSSREFNGKYYHNIDAWKINPVAAGATATAENVPFRDVPPPVPAAGQGDDDIDDLPF